MASFGELSVVDPSVAAEAFGLVEISEEVDHYSIRISKFNLRVMAVLIITIIVLFLSTIYLLLRLCRSGAEQQQPPPTAAAAAVPQVGAKALRTMACQSPATYKWWWSKPEFRALSDREHGAWG